MLHAAADVRDAILAKLDDLRDLCPDDPDGGTTRDLSDWTGMPHTDIERQVEVLSKRGLVADEGGVWVRTDPDWRHALPKRTAVVGAVWCLSGRRGTVGTTKVHEHVRHVGTRHALLSELSHLAGQGRIQHVRRGSAGKDALWGPARGTAGERAARELAQAGCPWALKALKMGAA